MAKSLRSKSKQAFRRIKRENPKSDFHMRDQIRTQRLAAKLRQLKPADKDDDNDDEEEYEDVSMDEEEEATAEHQGQTTSSSTDKNGVTTTTTTTTGGDDAEMAATAEAHVSTSGPRESSRLNWRKSRGMPASRKRTTKNSTTFVKPKSFKSTGKAAKGGKRSKK